MPGASLGSWTSSGERFLFSALPRDNKQPAVVKQLRTAIALGYLSVGDKLPRESDLAKQLGVTIFNLREALEKLRDEGLVVTRTGKSGGSFVCEAQNSTVLASNELKKLSATDLRDLGDWRQMLASRSAQLAAQRAGEANFERLTLHAGQLQQAENENKARRAYGRFFIELAAAAQSRRLSHAELSLHEEFDWLVSLVLTSTSSRDQVAKRLSAICEAIKLQRPNEASKVAGLHIATITEALGRQRLQLIAASYDASNEKTKKPLTQNIRCFLDGLLDQLWAISNEIAHSMATARNALEVHHRVIGAIYSHWGEVKPAVDGIGVLAEVGVIPENKYWLDWLRQNETGVLQPDDHHVLNPEREGFYDYASREFMVHPRRHRTPWAEGPYVDHGGVDDYLITLAVPIIHQGAFLGVTAVDLLVADLEKKFASLLAQETVPCALLNAENRVIVSNSLLYNAGEMVRDTSELQRWEMDRLGWTLVTFHS